MDVTNYEEASETRKFYEKQMDYILRNDVDGMIDNQYAEDGVLISPFDMLDTPPPHIVRGRPALKEFFKKYLAWHGSIQVESIDQFAGTDESVFFQATFTSQTGRWVVGDGWYLRHGKIAVHYSFAHKTG